MVPTAWLPPYTVQQLHEALGANFVSLGLLHSLSWFVIFGLQLLPIFSAGAIVAVVSGLLMLLISVKLLWPTGVPLPGIKTAGWGLLLVTLERFLKDSKYGSYHVYFARMLIGLYVLHAILLIRFAYSWYFMFAAVAYAILLLVHPGRRHYFRGLLHWLASSSGNR